MSIRSNIEKLLLSNSKQSVEFDINNNQTRRRFNFIRSNFQFVPLSHGDPKFEEGKQFPLRFLPDSSATVPLHHLGTKGKHLYQVGQQTLNSRWKTVIWNQLTHHVPT